MTQNTEAYAAAYAAPQSSQLAPQPSGGEALAMPSMTGSGPQLDIKRCVARGTGLWVTIAAVVYLFLVLILAASTFGTILLIAPIGWLVSYVFRKRLLARLKGSHLVVGPDQLPELYNCAKAYSERLGLKEMPDMFVAETNEINAVAFRIFLRKTVMFTDDAIWGAIQCGKPEALRFLIAHELAHHALGHTNMVRGSLSQAVTPLARLDELSADAVAAQLVGSREEAFDGLIFLIVGPQLMPYVNRGALLRQSAEVGADKNSIKAEGGMSHPLLLRRLSELQTSSLLAPR